MKHDRLNIDVPVQEKWLWHHKVALAKVKKGLEDSAAGRTKSRGSFAKLVAKHPGNEDH